MIQFAEEKGQSCIFHYKLMTNERGKINLAYTTQILLSGKNESGRTSSTYSTTEAKA